MVISWETVHWELSILLIYLLFPIGAAGAVYSTEKSAEKRKKDLKFFKNIVALCLGFMLFILSMLIYPAIGPWEVKDRGVFDNVEYTDTRVKKVPVGWRTLHKTILHFSDGRTAVLPGEYPIEFSKGTPIKVMTKNDFYKIVKDQ
ncbi:MAG: hypothetical protein HYY86_03540 [Candidatus Harrisonbacteria bacterium]|nr:hypothetical protein [Candidatus Harrisonbacteria bacterium]